ncbi:MAG: TonB-dependent receptor plug domain-containing protein [Reichenbachiella sp.]
MKKTLLGLCLILTTTISQAQDKNNDDMSEMSLEELMNMQVSVGSANKLTLRETPGIVTVITEKEIENIAARDMVDVLRLVPGLEFAGEFENTIGLGVRGNYAMEGKVLFMIDGQQINENGYGTVIFGNRFFVDNIKKIEIIRGPGSAIYGGLAELAVINIITKSGSDIDGGYASASYGISNGETSRVNAQFGIGKKLESGLELSLTGGLSNANRSNETIFYATDYDDNANGLSTTFNYADSSQTKSYDFNLGLNFKGLKVKALYQDYKLEKNNENADYINMGGIYLGGEYEWKISDKVTITPEISWKKENPWTYTGNTSDLFNDYYISTSYRTRGVLSGLWKASDNFQLTFGGEYYSDKLEKSNEAEPFSNGELSMSITNSAVFSEALIKTNIANIIIGARFDNHSRFGSAFVPRLAITRTWDKFHVKGLLSRAFKAPVLFNFDANPDIKAEFTNVAEIETGYLINENMSLVGNVFYIHIDDPILYVYNSVTEATDYTNFESASTIGFELDYRLKYNWGYVNTSYSFYKNNNSKVEPYEVEGNDNLLRGFPAHKFVINGGINAGKKIIISPTVILNSEKVGYFYQEEGWEGYGPYTYGGNFTFNLAINYRPIENMLISLASYDLFGQNYHTVNAYDAGYYGTPTMGREFVLKAKIKF